MENIQYVRISSFYKAAIEYYYTKFPEIVHEPYEKQYRHFMDQYYGLSDSYERELSDLKLNSFLIPVNVEILQKKWAEEHNISYNTPEELLIQQLIKLQPTIISIGDINSLSKEWLANIRHQVPSIKLIIGNCCSPYNDYTLTQYKKCDFVICCCNQLSEELQENGIKTHIIMHGFDEKILSRVQPAETRNIEILFTGSIMPLHQIRNKFINTLVAEGLNLTICGNIQADSCFVVRIKQAIYRIFYFISKLDKFELLSNSYLYKRILSKNYPQYLHINKKVRKKIQAPEFGLDMFQSLGKTQICLNLHGDIATKDAANMRLFEATGMGACLVTDWKANMCTLFDDGVEVITYKDSQDCVDKIKWLLKHPERMQQIAEAGQKRCLAQYSIKSRAKQLFDIITEELK